MELDKNKNSFNKKTTNNIYSLNTSNSQVPKSIDLEEVVLAALIIDNKAIDSVIDMLSEKAFFLPKHKEIFKAIHSLFENSHPVDIYTISEELKKKGTLIGVGGEVGIINITNKISSSANIEYHCRLLQQKAIKRELIHTSSNIITEAQDDSKDTFDVLDKAEANLFEIANNYLKKNTNSAEGLINDVWKNLQELKDRPDGVSGLNSGFRAIDNVTSGWQNSDLVVVAARPGMGKTAFILSMARNMAIDFNTPVAIFSLEMSGQQLITRFLSSESGVSSHKLKTGKLTDDEWAVLNNKITDIEKAPLYIDDTPSLSVFDLRAKARRLVSQNGVKMIMIDYLQLMTAGSGMGGAGLREQEISTISRNLKALAKELNIPIIALAQLSRQVEAQGGAKRPLLSHLRESGAIEQDADIVSFIYRPEYYKIDQWDDNDQGPTKNQAEFIIAKHRNGGLESIRLKFIPELTKFSDIDSLGFENYDNQGNMKTLPSKRNKSINPEEDNIFDKPKNNKNEETPF